MRRIWPRNLAGQMLLAVALSLLLAQLINSALLYRGQREQLVNQAATAAAIRLIAASERLERRESVSRSPEKPAQSETGRREFEERRSEGRRRWRRGRTRLTHTDPVSGTMQRLPLIEERLGEMLDNYGLAQQQLRVAITDASLPGRLQRKTGRQGLTGLEDRPTHNLVAALQRSDGQWLSVRMGGPPRGNRITGWLILQTLILYLVVLIPVVWLVRRFTRPLQRLTTGVESFRLTQDAQSIASEGPEDIARLIEAFNAMSHRISAMLSEKDVMLGAIGHDLKTPLAALRVRVESVEDKAQRSRMVAGIEDITRSLDDILVLARVGQPIAPPERVNITALVETAAEEFADLGQPVEMSDSPRIVLPVHVTWMRRAVRNLVGNAIRYGGGARVSLDEDDAIVRICVADDGPGIPEEEMERMFEPFMRLEASRNTGTGGSGLGLTLARAIVEQHGGTLLLRNRTDDSGKTVGMSATICLPRTP